MKVTEEDLDLIQRAISDYRFEPTKFNIIPPELIDAMEHLLNDWKQVSSAIANLGVEAQKVLEVWKKNGIIKT